MSESVVVTGLGVVSPLGLDVPSFWSALTAGRCAIGPIRNINTEGLTNAVAAEIHDFDPAKHFDPRKLPLLDRFSQMAVVAAREAVAQSGLPLGQSDLAEQTACIMGTGVGGQTTLEESYTKLMTSDRPNVRVHPFTVPRLMANAAGSQISMDMGITGPGFTVASACASSTHAIGVAYQMVRSGAVRAAVTGGSEACLTFGTLKGWEALRVMAPDTCRPFSTGRAGMVLGEGAAVVVLERESDAKARGAHILAHLAGFGMSSDARDITTPDANGSTRAMRLALRDAGLNPQDVDHINAHGTGTRLNDTTESAAMHMVFEAHTKNIAVSACKSSFGHALGGAGALEFIATVMALREGVAPPTLGFQGPDPECDLDIVANEARPMPGMKTALSNSFAFGGLNAVLALRRY